MVTDHSGKKEKTKKKSVRVAKPKKINHPAYYGHYNELSDGKRKEKFYKQWLERGFDDSVAWNLDYIIAQFISPRLKAFKENKNSYPSVLTPKEWDEILDKMIEGFDLIIDMDDWRYGEKSQQNYKKCQNGLKLFAKYYFDLWD